MIALGVAVLVAACGGGGADTTPKEKVTSVKVMGDSLADSGTFGLKFTVQGAASLIFAERVAQSYGVSALCPFFRFTGTTFIANPTAGCTNYSIGGGRINNATAPTSPVSIVQQLKTVTTYGAGDLLLIDGGGNDAADLVGAYLNIRRDGGAAYTNLLRTLLPTATVNAAIAGGAGGMAAAGGQYMVALAGMFHDAIKVNALDRGAPRVAVLNMPGILNTPRFQQVLTGVALASGGGSAGAAVRAQSEALFKGWIEAYNADLLKRFAGNTKVTVVDFYTSFNDQVANPAQFGLTNAKDTACPVTGVGGDGLPTYTFPTCTATALSAMTPPAGATGGANWWKTYAFSDSFHPTPYGHELLAQLISRSLATAGWL